MQEHEERLAVLNALGTATAKAQRSGQRFSVSSEVLFDTLPRVLRDRWSLKYLRNVVLSELISGEYVEVQQVGPGRLHYRITNKGERWRLLGVHEEEAEESVQATT